MNPDQPRIVRAPITRSELTTLAASRFGDLVEAVVDVTRGVMAVSGELHADEEALLLDDGSRHHDLWGINLYPAETGEDWIEFDSVINVRPSQNNRSRSVEDENTRAAIRRSVSLLPTLRDRGATARIVVGPRRDKRVGTWSCAASRS